MRIAQVAPLQESVPPRLYGGTERVISHLTEELVRLGHDVVLYASGDSETSAELRPMCERALRFDRSVRDPLAYSVLMLDRVQRDAHEFDLVHYHVDYLHYPLSRHAATPHLTTLHGRLDLPELVPIYRAFPDVPIASISNAQRRPLPFARWEATVHHGLPPDLFPFSADDAGHFAFVGRISPEKRVDRAIEIARRTGSALKIAAKVDSTDRDYFDALIAPLLDGPGIEYLGEVGDADKHAILAGARALLFPIDWPEPFGLVMIEALSCGTPVIAFCHGSVPEVITDGRNGFICESVDEAVQVIEQLDQLDRATVRRTFEERFSANTMARAYLEVYARLVEAHRHRAGMTPEVASSESDGASTP